MRACGKGGGGVEGGQIKDGVFACHTPGTMSQDAQHGHIGGGQYIRGEGDGAERPGTTPILRTVALRSAVVESTCPPAELMPPSAGLLSAPSCDRTEGRGGGWGRIPGGRREGRQGLSLGVSFFIGSIPPLRSSSSTFLNLLPSLNNHCAPPCFRPLLAPSLSQGHPHATHAVAHVTSAPAYC